MPATPGAAPPHIGTLNEGHLHESLKAIYARQYGAHDGLEVPVGGYVADVCGSDEVLYEIQTGSFSPLKKKLAALVESHRVVLVYPIAATLTIVKIDHGGDELSRRRSPKRGRVSDVLEELVYIPGLLDHPNFELEVALVDVDERRLFDPARVRRRNGWRVVGRQLTGVVELRRFRSLDDVLDLVTCPLPSEFTTADLAAGLDRPRGLAQKLAYVLRCAGRIDQCGKHGNAIVYRLT